MRSSCIHHKYAQMNFLLVFVPFFDRSDEACVRFLNFYCNFSRFIRTNEFFAIFFCWLCRCWFQQHTIRRRFFFANLFDYFVSLGMDDGHFIVVFNVLIWWRWRQRWWHAADFIQIHCCFSSSMTLDFVNMIKNRMFNFHAWILWSISYRLTSCSYS